MFNNNTSPGLETNYTIIYLNIIRRSDIPRIRDKYNIIINNPFTM